MTDPQARKNPVRVLVIEDNADDRELLLRQLKKAQIAEQVKFISDGQEAYDFIVQDQVDLASSVMVIFLDLKLPGLSGLELLRKIKVLKGIAAIPVIVMTSSNKPSDMEECQQLKVVNYVEKPVTFTAFTKAMADVFHLPRQVSTVPVNLHSDR